MKILLGLSLSILSIGAFAKPSCYESLKAIGESDTAIDISCLEEGKTVFLTPSMMDTPWTTQAHNVNSEDNFLTANKKTDWLKIKVDQARFSTVAKQNSASDDLEEARKIAAKTSAKSRLEFDQIVQKRCLLFSASLKCNAERIDTSELITCTGKTPEIIKNATQENLTQKEKIETILKVTKDMGIGHASFLVRKYAIEALKLIPEIGPLITVALEAKKYYWYATEFKKIAVETSEQKDDDSTWLASFNTAMKARADEIYCYRGAKQFEHSVRITLDIVKRQATQGSSQPKETQPTAETNPAG